MEAKQRVYVPYETFIISLGAYKQVHIKLDISTSIWIAIDTPTEELAGDFVHYFNAWYE